MVDPEKKRYEYERAEGTIEDILNYYPDSSVVADISTQVSESKAVLLGELHISYVEQLLAKNFLPIDDKDDITDVLSLLQRVASTDPIFTDPRLVSEYRKAISKDVANSDIEAATAHLEVAKTYIPKSALFNELNDQIVTASINNQLVLEQRKTEGSFKGENLTIHDYKNYTDDLMILSLNSTYRSNQYRDFKSKFEKEFSKLVSNSPTSAKELYTNFSLALSADEIISYSGRTGLVPKTSATVSASNYPRINFIKDDSNLDTLIKQMTSLRQAVVKYRNNVLTHYNANFESTMDPLVTNLRPTLISYYSKLYSDVLIPETTRKINAQATLASNNLNANIKNTNALAIVENNKRIFRNFANDNKLNQSVDKYKTIANVATESDQEFLEYAEGELSRMYATLAESKATEYEFQDAYNYIIKAKEFLTNEDIEKQERNYKKEVMAEEEVAALIITQDETDKIQAQEVLNTLKADYIDEYTYVLDSISDTINTTIIEIAETELIDAHRLKKHAQTLINTRRLNNVRIAALPEPSLLAAQGKIEVTQFNLTAATQTLAAAITQTPDHYQIDELREVLYPQVDRAEEYYEQHIKYFNEELYDDAETSLASALSNWKDNPDYLNRHAFYEKVMLQVNAGSKLCREDLQGIGKRNRGACNDIVMSTKGAAPTMVVIPAMNKNSLPYAISKYEISQANFNAFCKKSEKCTPVSDDLAPFPATKVPVDLIAEYAAWLSVETGFNYKIASYDEWSNATAAAGREGNSDYNCRLRLGTKLIKGQNIVPVESGAQNNWGLINYVGNVDEIVADNNGYKLVGGNFADSISDCKITLSKPFNLTATSGFRLVRSLF